MFVEPTTKPEDEIATMYAPSTNGGRSEITEFDIKIVIFDPVFPFHWDGRLQKDVG